MTGSWTIGAVGAGLVAFVAGSPVAEAARFCRHGGKQYAIFATRCEAGKKLRCVSADTWKAIGTCR